MTTADIWNLPVEQRLSAFIERYKDLDEQTGNRTGAERDEMQMIAEAVMPELIRAYERGLTISDIHGAEKERDQWREANIASEAHAVELVGKLDDAERERDEWKKAATKNIKMLHAAQDRIAELEAALRQIADHYRHGADMMDIARAALSAPAQPVKEHCPRRLMGETLAPHAPCDTGDHSRDAQPATAAAKCNECGKVIEEENAYAQDGRMFHADCWRKRTAPSSHAHDCAIAMNARHECTCVAAPPSPAAREANDPDTEDLMLGPCFDCECTTVDNGLCPCLCHPDNQPDAKAVISSTHKK